MSTKDRVILIHTIIDQIQKELARAAAHRGMRDKLESVRQLAAKLDFECEDWHLELLQIPPQERAYYRSTKGYYYN
ncbi:hypothetical protein NRA16_17780 [Acinetobacter baumannii]|nr:hypothetical protein [Acinetobacter baumannii]